MCKKLIYLVSFVLVLSVASSVQAEPFSLVPTFDGHVSNDAQEGPDSSPGGSGMHIRDIGGRRRVAFVTYDISEIKARNVIFSNVSFSNYGHDTGTVNVYGILEAYEDLVAEGITWNTAPGVQNNPTPGLDSPVELDLADVTDILLTFNAPSRGTRASTETSEALADFLNDDTDGFVALMFAPAEGGNAIVRTVEMGENGGTWLEGNFESALELSLDPNPAEAALDVPRDVILSWKPGVYAHMHDVYFGTSFDDVNDATTTVDPNNVYQGRQIPNRFPISGTSNLEFGRTYYWRIDEVSAPPDLTIYKGNVWQFTVEPFAIPIPGENITATASSYTENQGPENTVNGSGLDDNDLHSTESGAMWLSSSIGVQPTWIQYEFDKVYKLHEMWVWNSNTEFESLIGFGLKDVTIEYSANGTDWTELGGVPEFAQAPGKSDYAHDTTVDFSGAAVKYVKITANSHWGFLDQYGLSEVRFLYIPVHAREPSPDTGAADVDLDVVLGWRAGREAAGHDVYLSTDEQAVIDGTAPVSTVTEARYGPLSLDLSSTYYWRIDEVNDTQTPTTWEGEIWNFTTPEYLVVDDFEDYNDYEPDTVYLTWTDGWDNILNGSTIGYPNPDFINGEHYLETGNVHGGEQSAPVFYDNSSASYSEVTANTDDLAIGRNWTIGAPETLVLWFHGDPGNAVTEQMYVKLNGVKVVYDGDAGDIARLLWKQWNIDLAAFGVNLSNVTQLSIGFERTGALGGSGVVLIDDIRLYRLAPAVASEEL